MKFADCTICEKKHIPLNDTIKIDRQVYCSSCFEANFQIHDDLKDKLVEKEIDSTICSSCNTDFGDLELNKIASYHICEDCELKIKERTFPKWVKGFFIGVLAIVIIGFAWNWKYYEAYSYMHQSLQYAQKSDYKNATGLMNLAIKKVPEVEDLKTLYTYFNGIEFLIEDKNTAALEEFNKCREKLPAGYDIDKLIIQAKIGSTFDNKNYEGFLDATKENLAIDSSTALSLSSVASAYACIYASKGNDDAKQNAINYLNRSKAIDDTSREMKEYYNMIAYRIDSRKIITREEFTKQFPNGWTKN